MTKHHAILDAAPGCGTEKLKARWRALASQHHPDRGGNPLEFSTFRNAYQAALKYEATEEAKCKKCGGTGKVLFGNGFNKISMVCPLCKGTK
jgi:DnaJ-class molecular chaperone